MGLRDRPWRIVGLLAALVLLSAAGPTTVEGVDQEETGDRFFLNLGETFELRLPGNPTTGYAWEVSDIDDQMVRLVRQDFISGPAPTESRGPVAGAGGTFIFIFQAIGHGTTSVDLVYHRPWEKDAPPLETHSVQISVHSLSGGDRDLVHRRGPELLP
jgi:inhibitor of cysteine peptidase